ncbi:hypothetical protein ACINK0_15690 [Deinococcus sp. VB343]|uniref:Integrase n=1 Tax=Deinococcus sp. VB142 TaxID=3112952 RepID=A0AAU6Q6V1_9DEIO
MRTLDMGLLTPTAATFLTRYAAVAGGRLETRPTREIDLDSGEYLVRGTLTVKVSKLRGAIKRFTPRSERRRAALVIACYRLGLNRGQYTVQSGRVYEGAVPTCYRAVRLSKDQGICEVSLADRALADMDESPKYGKGATPSDAIKAALNEGWSEKTDWGSADVPESDNNYPMPF